MGNSKWVSNDVDRRERAQRTDNGGDQTPLDSRMFTVWFYEHILGYQLIGSASHIQGEISLAPSVISRVSACSISSAPVLGDSLPFVLLPVSGGQAREQSQASPGLHPQAF